LRFAGWAAVGPLRHAVKALFDRHEALRTRFDALGETQSVQPLGSIEPPLDDLTSLGPADRDMRFQAILRDEVETPFDLVNGPPARVRIVVETAERYALVLTAHHIVSDGWSVWLLCQELPRLYAAALRGEATALPPAIPFRRHVLRETGAEGRTRGDAALAYWRSRFRDAPPALDLPLDRPRPPIKTYRGGWEVLRLGATLSARIKRSAAGQGSTTAGFLLAVFQVLLHRLSGQTDIVVGLPASVRDRDDGTLVGHVTNLLPIRLQIDGRASFAEHLQAAKRALLEAREHQALTFGTLVRELGLARDPSRPPVLTATFNMVSGRLPRQSQDGVVEVVGAPRSHVHFELELSAVDEGSELAVECSYNADLFARETVRRWLSHYRMLLVGVGEDPRCMVSALPLLTEGELAEQREWNATGVRYSSGCVHDLISAQAGRTPGRVALGFEGRSLSYRELEEGSERLARRLRGRGIGPGVRVGVYMERSPEMVVGILGVLKAGGAYVPLDPAFPAERLSYIVEDSGAAVLLTHGAVGKDLPSRAVPVVRVDADEGGADTSLEGVRACSDDLAYVIYTSGSTGRPKGVGVTHRSLVNLLESMGREPGLDEADVLLSVTTLSFDIAALELYLPLIKGGRIELASREEVQDDRRLMERLGRSGVSVMQATPATWRMLLESGWEGTPGLKVLCGGEVLTRDLAEELLKRAGEVWNVYGPTETTVWSSAWRVESGEGPISIGRPIGNTQMWVLDGRLEPQPVGVPGELYIGGAGIARGYWERSELTAERFVPDPFSGEAGARMYRTGDLARWLPDGRLECLGRIDHQVKVRGFRIELGEIEATLRECPGVEEAVVVAQEVEGGDRRLAAFLTHGATDAANVTELRTHLKARLPAYMVPSSFVFLGRLPLTPNGKVDRKALLKMAGGGQAPRATQVAPRTAAESLVADLWMETLRLPGVSVQDNFFDLGGHSLLAMRVLAAIEKRTGHRLNPREIVFQTLEQVAASLEKLSTQAPAAPAGQRGLVGRMLDALRAESRWRSPASSSATRSANPS
jgi:amino acid adenylation domain-containing protein